MVWTPRSWATLSFTPWTCMTRWDMRIAEQVPALQTECFRSPRLLGLRWTRGTRDRPRTTPATSSVSTRSSRETTERSLSGTGFTGQVSQSEADDPLSCVSIFALSGARMLYKNLPRNVGLRRLTLHKSATGPNVNYILLVECSHFLDNINQVCGQQWEDQHLYLTPSGGQPAAGVTGQDMRLHRDIPDSGVLLTPASTRAQSRPARTLLSLVPANPLTPGELTWTRLPPRLTDS